MESETIQLTYDGAGGRFDAWLSAHIPELSRSRLQALLAEGAVRTGEGNILASKSKVLAGTTIVVTLPPPIPADPIPEDIPLDILYEDTSIIVLNKPAGIVVHPAPGHETQTIVNALLYHCSDLKGVGGVARPGIVHRLDMDTTGILVVAKDEQSLNNLAEQFQRHTTEKEYVALVHGVPSALSGRIVSMMGRHPTDRKKRAFEVTNGGKEAITNWVIEKRFSQMTLLRVRIETGRTHQIRVHLSHIKLPIVGDPLYGNRSLDKRIEGCPKRQMLHANSFSFTHPVTGERMTFTAPLPRDFMELLERV